MWFKRLKRIYRPIVALLVRSLAWCARHLPRRLALACGDGLGRAAYHLYGRRRRVALENLARVFGRDRSRRDLARVMRDFARLFGRSLFETMRIPAMTEHEILSLVDADSFEPVEEALARGKGLLIFSAHVGAWEIGAAYLAIRFGKPFHLISIRPYYRGYYDLLVRNRLAAGIEPIYQDEGARPLLALLRKNRPLITMADVKVLGLSGVTVEFLGERIEVPSGPAALARASRATVVPMFVTWKGLRHRLHVLPEIEIVRTRDKRADLAHNIQACTRAVEGIVRRHPEQWAGWHHKWRTEPPKPQRPGHPSRK